MTKYFNLVTDTARKSILDYVASDAFVLSDYAEKNNLECELEKYMKYAYIDNLDSYDYIKELIKNTPEEYSKYNVSKEQLKRIVDSINNETYFEVVEQITKEVIEFRNKMLGTEKGNNVQDNDENKTQSEFCFIDNTKLKELAKECKTYVQKVLDEEKEVENIQINDVVSPELKSNNSFFDQISAAVSGVLKACEENRLSHECINSESEKGVENIQNNDAASPELKSDNNYKSKRRIIEIFLK